MPALYIEKESFKNLNSRFSTSPPAERQLQDFLHISTPIISPPASLNSSAVHISLSSCQCTLHSAPRFVFES